MASKLSINQIGVNQGLAQIKTGEMFIVVDVDVDAKKATLKSTSGEEKSVSKATLERWYRELSDEEVVALGKTMNGGSDDVQEQDESASTEEAGESKNADDVANVAETENDADSSDAIFKKLREMYGASTTGNEPDGGSADIPGDCDGSGGEAIERADSIDEAGDSDNGNDESEINSPITPSNAGKDKDKAKETKNPEPKNAALMKVRQRIIDTILADSPSIQLKGTTSYDVLKEKHNFAEITHGSNRFNVSVISKCLTPDQLSKVKVNPASFGWSIDADFTVFDETDIEMAVKLIRQSREYRLANPVTRKKKEKK